MLQSVPVLIQSVRNPDSATAARFSPFAVTSGSRNFAGSSAGRAGCGCDKRYVLSGGRRGGSHGRCGRGGGDAKGGPHPGNGNSFAKAVAKVSRPGPSSAETKAPCPPPADGARPVATSNTSLAGNSSPASGPPSYAAAGVTVWIASKPSNSGWPR